MSYKFADSLRAGSGRNWFRPDIIIIIIIIIIIVIIIIITNWMH